MKPNFEVAFEGTDLTLAYGDMKTFDILDTKLNEINDYFPMQTAQISYLTVIQLRK